MAPDLTDQSVATSLPVLFISVSHCLRNLSWQQTGHSVWELRASDPPNLTPVGALLQARHYKEWCSLALYFTQYCTYLQIANRGYIFVTKICTEEFWTLKPRQYFILDLVSVGSWVGGLWLGLTGWSSGNLFMELEIKCGATFLCIPLYCPN